MKKALLFLEIVLVTSMAIGQNVPATKPIVKGMIWVGQPNPPVSPDLYEQYKDSDDGLVYEWNGSAWAVNVGTQGLAGADGAPGPAGADGADGQGVPIGGAAGQVLSKVDGTDFNTQWIAPAAGGGADNSLSELDQDINAHRTIDLLNGNILEVRAGGHPLFRLDAANILFSGSARPRYPLAPLNNWDLTNKQYVDEQVAALPLGTDDQTATEVTFAPNGSISSTNVQLAIQEVRDEAASGGDFTKVGTTVNNELLVATGDGLAESEPEVTFDKSTATSILKVEGVGGDASAGTRLIVKNLDDGAGHPGGAIELISEGWGEWAIRGNGIKALGATSGKIEIGTYDAGFRIRNAANDANILYVDNSGNVTATAFIGDGSGLTGINSALSSDNQLKIDNANVTKRIPVNTDYTISTSENAHATASPYEGKVETYINGDYTFLLDNAEPLNTLFTIKAGLGVTDSVEIRRNLPTINFFTDGKTLATPSDNTTGFYLRKGKTAIGKRIADNEYEFTCDCHPFTASECTADPGELMITANAASDPNCNQVDGTAGWGTYGSGVVLESVSDVDAVGGFAIKGSLSIVETSASKRIHWGFSAIAGHTYRVIFKAKTTQFTKVYIRGWRNVSSGGPDEKFESSTYAQKSYDVVATATGTIYCDFWLYQYGGDNVIGDNIFVDNFSAIDLNL